MTIDAAIARYGLLGNRWLRSHLVRTQNATGRGQIWPQTFSICGDCVRCSDDCTLCTGVKELSAGVLMNICVA